MNFIKSFTNLALATTAATAVAGLAPAAQAFSIGGSGITGTYVGQTCAGLCSDFATAGYTTSGGYVGTKNNYGTNALKPGNDSGSAGLVSTYNVTSRIEKPEASASTDILVSGLQNSFSFYWGSIDTHNVVTFLLGDTVQGVLTGRDLAGVMGWGAPTNDFGNYRRDAFLRFNGAFDAIKFSIADNVTKNTLASAIDGDNEGNGVAFEMAATPVPEPGTLLMVGGSLFMASQLKRRQSEQSDA